MSNSRARPQPNHLIAISLTAAYNAGMTHGTKYDCERLETLSDVLAAAQAEMRTREARPSDLTERLVYEDYIRSWFLSCFERTLERESHSEFEVRAFWLLARQLGFVEEDQTP